MIGIKDMSGLLRPFSARCCRGHQKCHGPPIHFHTHPPRAAASPCAWRWPPRLRCDRLRTASMADGTSQPSLNAFVAMMESAPNATGLKFLSLAIRYVRSPLARYPYPGLFLPLPGLNYPHLLPMYSPLTICL